MFKKIWGWLKGDNAPETTSTYGTQVTTPTEPAVSTGQVQVTWVPSTSNAGNTSVAQTGLGGGSGSTGTVTVKPKRKYTKKNVDNASVYVADDVEADLTAKGVDVDKAVETTLKKSSPKPKKSKPKKVVKKQEFGYNKGTTKKGL